MKAIRYYQKVLKNYAEFNGRAHRSEYWYFFLTQTIIFLLLGSISYAVGDQYGIIGYIYNFATLIPAVAVTVRRLHDVGRSGWWWLIMFVPVFGVFILLYFLIQDSTPEENEYGPNPKGGQK